MIIYGIFGAGGFGREVMPLARIVAASESRGIKHELVFVVDDGYPINDKNINGHRVLSMGEFLAAPASTRFYNIAIGNSRVRERISQHFAGKDAKPFSIRGPNHIAFDNNIVGEGSIFCSYTHITSNAKIGRFFQCNIYSYVAHDCVIGDFVTFAPGVMCNGHVVVEDHAYIGTGVVIKDGTNKPIVIGKGAIIGMGAVVTKSVPAGATVIGNPAKERISEALISSRTASVDGLV